MSQSAKYKEFSKEEKIIVYGKNIQVTKAIKDHIIDKLVKLEEWVPHILEMKVYLEKQRAENRVEILCLFSHFEAIVHTSKEDMYEAIDIAVHKMKRKLRKWKDKIQDHQAKKPSEIEVDVQILDQSVEDLEEINEQIEDENYKRIIEEFSPPKIVKTHKKSLPILTMDEAAMRMDLSRNAFLVYKNEEDQKIKVMYTKKDHTLGVLEIE